MNKLSIQGAGSRTERLARFAATLTFDDIPEAVVDGIKDLFVDWLGSALAGARAKPTLWLRDFASAMGPAAGPSTDFSGGAPTSPYFAAMISAASSHVVEQDDLHNSSVLHPACVVFPAVVAAAESLDVSGRDVLVAAIVGYEVGIRLGEFLGRSHYVHFHTTGTVGTLAAAAAVGRLVGLDASAMGHALGTAGTKAAGLWEFLATAADSKQMHTAGAASSGLMAAYAARGGITGAARVFDGLHGMGAAMSKDADPTCLDDRLGSRWATLETSYKWHASCRHTHPAADALLKAIAENDFRPDNIAGVTARVHKGAIDVLGPVTNPQTIHQAKFSMGTVLGLIALYGKAGLAEFDAHALTDPAVVRFRDTVTMVLDPEIDAAYPKRWIGHVEVALADGRQVAARVTDAKGDPGNPLTRAEIEDKARALAAYGGIEQMADVERWIAAIRNLDTDGRFAGTFERSGR